MASQLDPLALGLVLAGLGMGGTLLTLFVLSLIVDLLKRLFPAQREVPSSESRVPSPAQATELETRNSEPGTR